MTTDPTAAPVPPPYDPTAETAERLAQYQDATAQLFKEPEDD